MRAATDWIKYRHGGAFMPGVGEWCLWSVVTKHGREYYGGSRLHGDTHILADCHLRFEITDDTYFARVVGLEDEPVKGVRGEVK